MVNRRHGFVLVMVLLVLAVAGTSLTLVARESCRHALRAAEAREQLQCKWGSRSIRDYCLPQAERLLQAKEAETDRPEVEAPGRVELGGMTFDWVVTDEQAKAKVNCLAMKRTNSGLAGALRALQSGLVEAPHVELRPLELPSGPPASLARPYRTLDQLFRGLTPEQLGSFGGMPGAAGRVTCWGSGQVNFRRAEPIVLRETLAGVLTEEEITKLVRFRRKAPDCTLLEAMDALELPGERRGPAMEAMTDMSRCHGLWVRATGRSRRWCRLYLDEVPNPLGKEPQVFAW